MGEAKQRGTFEQRRHAARITGTARALVMERGPQTLRMKPLSLAVRLICARGSLDWNLPGLSTRA